MALGDFVLKTAVDQRAEALVLLGDLYHTHGVIDANVQHFWWQFFEAADSAVNETIVIKGNHDAPGEDGAMASALFAHTYQCRTVMHAPLESYGILFCPYTSGEQLEKWANEHPECKTLVCHQTFDGSTYENGFYAGDGVDQEKFPQQHIISGHIHSPQEFGKVWYPGAPRWRTLADANVDRAIWLVEFEDGVPVKKTSFDTSSVCRKIVLLEDVYGEAFLCKPRSDWDYRIVSRGPAAWLEERRAFFASWARWRGVATDTRVAVVKESDGIDLAFEKWLTGFQPKHSTHQDVLRQMVKERIGNLAV